MRGLAAGHFTMGGDSLLPDAVSGEGGKAGGGAERGVSRTRRQQNEASADAMQLEMPMPAGMVAVPAFEHILGLVRAAPCASKKRKMVDE